MKGISVILCCYNSAQRLPVTLRFVAQQEVPRNIPWEVIVVNNRSTDDTAKVAKTEWEKHSCDVPFKVADQPVPGLSAAREKGMEVSSFEYLVFCDDDNWLDENYLRNAFITMETHPDVGIAGGQSTGFFEIPKPFWFDSVSPSYVVEKVLPVSGYLPPRREYLAGAGMVVRRELINDMKAVRFKSILTGRMGTSLTSGEDYEFCLVAGYLGYRIYYDEQLSLIHLMTRERLSWEYFIRMTTKGHAIPEVIYSLYRVGRHAGSSKNRRRFHRIYFEMVKQSLNTMIYYEVNRKNSLRFFFRHLHLFFRLVPGSLLQKHYLSYGNRLVFLLRNFTLLNKHYDSILALFDRIALEKNV